MRLAPIEKPPSLLGKLLNAGDPPHARASAITPSQVIYNRVPAAWRITLAFLRFERSARSCRTSCCCS